MLVEQLIRQLEEYPPFAELYVEYWDKETVEIMEDTTLTDDEWEDVVYQMEEEESSFATSTQFGVTIEKLRMVPLTEKWTVPLIER